MNADVLMLIAFCLFIVLLGVRMKQYYSKKDETVFLEGKNRGISNWRRWIIVIQLFLLGGFSVYMFFVILHDVVRNNYSSLTLLRCVIWLLTIVFLIWQVARLLREYRKKRNR